MTDNSPGNENKFESSSEKGQHTAEDLKHEAKEAVQKVGRRVKEGASEAASEVKEQAKSTMHQQQTFAAEKVHAVGAALRESADRLREENAETFANLLDQAADRIDNFSRQLREQELSDMLENAQDWARRNPVVVLGGSFLAGLVIARLLKSAASQGRSDESYGRVSSTSSMERESYEPAYRPRDVGQSRFGEQSSMGQQYGGSAFSPSSPSPGIGETGTRGSAGGGWEEP